MNKIDRKYWLIVIAFVLGCAADSVAQLHLVKDVGFGNAGQVLVDIDQVDELHGVLRLADGSLVAFGFTAVYDTAYNQDAVVLKLDSNGIWDPTFGNNGVSRFDFPSQFNSRIVDMVEHNGDFYFIGEANPTALLDSQAVFVGKLTSNGTIDVGFANNGYFSEYVVGKTLFAAALLVDNGNIVFAGTAIDTVAFHSEMPLVGRLLPNGQRDSTFGGSGIITWSAYNGISNASGHNIGLPRHTDGAQMNDLVILPDGRYLCAGYSFIGDQTIGFSMMFEAQGALDMSYGQGGWLITDLTPGFSNSIEKAFFINNRLYFACSSSDISGIYNFHIKAIELNNAPYAEQVLDFEGNNNRLQDACFDGSQLFLAGWSRNANSTGVGHESDFLALAIADTALDPVAQFSGQFYAQTVVADAADNGATAICNYDANRLIMAGFADVEGTDNLRDAVLVRVHKTGEALGLPSVQGNNPVRVFPNPASEYVTIVGLGSLARIELYDLTGHCTVLTQAGTKVNLPMLAPGIYLLRLSVADGSHYQQKLLIEH